MISSTKYRNKVYRIALEFFKDRNSSKKLPFLCRCLTFAVSEMEFNIDNEEEKPSILSMSKAIQEIEPIWYFFPEILKHKPQNISLTTKYNSGYWFKKNEEGQQKRLAILEQAIQETTT